ncbi:13538_t:CDS:2, partial [Rhizophagus irregularis]
GYESSNTVETRNIFPDPDYTPSQPTGGYPTITSSIGSKFKKPKKSNNIHNIISPSFSSTSNNEVNSNFVSTDHQNSQSTFHNYLDIISDYKQIIFATHNIQGGFQSKKDKIIELMVVNKIDFLHVCETNERDNNFDISKSKAHLKYQ